MADNRCDTCRCNKVCDHDRFGFENCENYISEDCVEVVRCKDCKYGEIDDADFPHQYLCHFRGDDWNHKYHYCGYGKRRKDDDV